jgi:hypothetical protein
VSKGVPKVSQAGGFNYAIDQHFRTPYSIEWSLGVQRELPGNFILDAYYVGRQARKEFSQADAAQILDFKDNTSGQFMIAAFNALQAQIASGLSGAALTSQPWFENQMNSASIANYGGTCLAVFGTNCTRVLAANDATQVLHGDTSDAVFFLYSNGLPNSAPTSTSRTRERRPTMACC